MHKHNYFFFKYSSLCSVLKCTCGWSYILHELFNMKFNKNNSYVAWDFIHIDYMNEY